MSYFLKKEKIQKKIQNYRFFKNFITGHRVGQVVYSCNYFIRHILILKQLNKIQMIVDH